MEELVALLRLLEFDILNYLDGKSSLLVEGIRKGKYSSSSQVDIYKGKNKAILTSQLISKVKSRVLNLMLIHPDQWKGSMNHQEETWRRVSNFKAMVIRGRRKESKSEGDRILKQAIKKSYSEIIILVAKDLMHGAGLVGDRKSFLKYKKLMNKYNEVVKVEHDLLVIYFDMITREKRKIELINKVEEFVLGMDEVKLVSNFSYVMFCHVKIFLALSKFDYLKVIGICEKAIVELELRKATVKNLVFGFRLRKAVAQLGIAQYENAIIEVEKAEVLYPESGYNNVVVNINKMIVLIHAKKFNEAVVTFKNCDNLELHEEWFKLIGAYLNFVEDKDIRIGKFLNEVPKFSKDKTGYNLIVIGVQLLHLLKQRKMELVIEKIDSLVNYKTNYLNSDATKRAKVFVKMLIELKRGNFNRINVENRTKDLYTKLINQEFEIPLNLIIEIIPFDQIWNQVLSLLGTHTTKYK